MPIETPIAFFIFNRPELTAQVFEAISAAKPNQLFLIGDGPRADREAEATLVERCREIVGEISWPCDVQTNFSESNLGCAQRMASGLDWAFSISERLIILEDDCLPDPSFFGYCQTLLDRYEFAEQVMMISGDNFQPKSRTIASYYFSRWPHIWGWASWRRAWDTFDLNIEAWPRLKVSSEFKNQFCCRKEFEFWTGVFDRVHAGEIDTWDFSWALACWQRNGLTILPDKNLIKNIGFGSDATHTTDPSSTLAGLQTHDIGELSHPGQIMRNEVADDYTWHNVIAPPTPTPKTKWFQKILQPLGAMS